ncbi:Rieske (2Fe-2S) protein [Stutzerimonas stutzeri]|uniref:Rieske 2Fe-2S domain-containing protein n=1 Tax=Stutzerimonas stutzeri TaxID=316 RepID=A0A6I6LPT8_STUST|nr:Rieske (2Fe-2S) protein [Stutzerimonas stutzeri]QGZ31180.1 Rieske 2Fe-2S domain-containing protein [Stutzerimonas stutzeri]
MSTLESAELIATSGTFQRIGSVAALLSGEPLGAVVDGKEVAVFAADGGFVATSGICPHAQGPLHEGEVEDGVLTCPWHGWTFNLESGQCDEDPGLCLERYEVKVEGDDILVRV